METLHLTSLRSYSAAIMLLFIKGHALYTQCFSKQTYVLQVVEGYGLGAQAHPCESLVLLCILTLE